VEEDSYNQRDLFAHFTIETVDLQNKIKSQNDATKKLQWIGGFLTLVIAVLSPINLLIQAGYF
jgi:cytochrome c oxidase assembly factor CtaG